MTDVSTHLPPTTVDPQPVGTDDPGLADRATTAAAEAKGVAGQAADQVRSLAAEAKSSLTDHSSDQRDRAVRSLRDLGSEWQRMSEASGSGPASTVVQELGRRTDSVATYLQDHEPSQVLADVRTYAREHPGLFIGIAAGLGLLAGRATKAMTSSTASKGKGTTTPFEVRPIDELGGQPTGAPMTTGTYDTSVDLTAGPPIAADGRS